MTEPPVSAATLEAFFGLAAGTPAAEWIYEGSAIRSAPFTATAEDTLLFDVDFLSNDSLDRAFYVLTSGSTSSLVTLLDSEDLSADSSTGIFASETLFQTFGVVVPTTCTYALGFGVVDRGDTHASSALIIDNVRQIPTPEPNTASLLGLGLLVLAGRRGRPRAGGRDCGSRRSAAAARQPTRRGAAHHGSLQPRPSPRRA